MWWLALIAAYLLGGLPIAWWIGRKNAQVDLRETGSKNPGTSNLFRHAGWGPAAIAGPLQFAQGFLPVLLMRFLSGNFLVAELCAVTVLLGNCWPLLNRFRGQRGIAVASGAVAGLNVPAFATLLLVFAVGAALQQIALAVLAGFSALPLVAVLIGDRQLAVTFVALLIIIVVRRLAGSQKAGLSGALLISRLLWDRSPGQRLVG